MHIYILLFFILKMYNTDKRKISIHLVVVKTISYYELIRYIKAVILNIYIYFSSVWLIKKCTYTSNIGISL